MARQLLILCACLPHGIETVACRSSCSLDSSRSRPEAMRHWRPWREVMRAATSVDSAAVAASAWTFREAENSGAASLAGAPVTSGYPHGGEERVGQPPVGTVSIAVDRMADEIALPR